MRSTLTSRTAWTLAAAAMFLAPTGNAAARVKRIAPSPLETRETLVQTLVVHAHGAAPDVSVRERRKLRATARLKVDGIGAVSAATLVGIRVGDWTIERALGAADRWTPGKTRASWIARSLDGGRPGTARMTVTWNETSLRVDVVATGQAPVCAAHDADPAGAVTAPFDGAVRFGGFQFHLGGQAKGKLARVTADILGTPLGLARLGLAGKAGLLDVTQDSAPPAVTIETPRSGAIIQLGDVQMTGSLSDNRSLTRVTYAIGGAAEIDAPFAVVPDSGFLVDVEGSFSFAVRPPEGRSTLHVNAYDGAGNRGTASIDVVMSSHGAPVISAGADHVVFKDALGRVQTWGYLNQAFPSAPQFAAVSNVRAVSAGSDMIEGGTFNGPTDYRLALLDDGTIAGWGADGYGELAGGTTTTYVATPTVIPSFDHVAAVAAVGLSPMALRDDGTVWMWGYPGFNSFADGSNSMRLTPAQVPGLPTIRIIASAAGGQMLYALDDDGAVWRWGVYDSYSQVYTAPTKVAGLPVITSIWADGACAVAIAGDGTAWTWGSNDMGRLGHPTAAGNAPAQVQLEAGGPAFGIKAASSGNAHTLFLTTAGTVLATGCRATPPSQIAPSYGQVGDGVPAGHLAAVPVPGLSNVIAIAAGRYSSYAVLADGSVMAWGLNDKGQLGDGTTQDQPTPVRVVLAQ